jgi:hypothetical protein
MQQKEGAKDRTTYGSDLSHNDEPWDSTEIQPHEEDNEEVLGHCRPKVVSAGEVGKHDRPWKTIFLRHYLLLHRWLHACDPLPGGGNAAAKPAAEGRKVMRAVVTGMKSSGKSHFLRAIAPDQQVHR